MTATSIPRPPDRETVLSTIQPLLLSALAKAHAALDRILPPSRRSALQSRLTTFATSHPHLATFLLSQLIFCVLPLLLFLLSAVGILVASLVTVLVAGVLGAVLFTGFCVGVGFLFVVLPVSVVAAGSGVAAWFWGWGVYYALRWVGVVDWDAEVVGKLSTEGVVRAHGGEIGKGGEQQQQQQQESANGVMEKDSQNQRQGEEKGKGKNGATDTDTAAGKEVNPGVVKKEKDEENTQKINGPDAVVDGEAENVGPNTSMGTDHVV
ncbi:hypothetical protein VTN00DRAFT_6025 [Thermoascus crustaceus]|uniref:uncharacterized protein n=1 Tax=Thermoascus crustaceus TaxID=5088 RepID=UPI0037430127